MAKCGIELRNETEDFFRLILVIPGSFIPTSAYLDHQFRIQLRANFSKSRHNAQTRLCQLRQIESLILKFFIPILYVLLLWNIVLMDELQHYLVRNLYNKQNMYSLNTSIHTVPDLVHYYLSLYYA